MLEINPSALPRKRRIPRRKSRKAKTLGPARQYFIFNGRNSLGSVTEIDGHFVAFDNDGSRIGRFSTLLGATRALPERA